MSDTDVTVATLAALFVPGTAGTLLARRAGGEAAAAVRHASQLAGAPRRVRLDALTAALSSSPSAPRAAAEAAARAERPRVAALLRALAEGVPSPELHPALLRLCRERLGR